MKNTEFLYRITIEGNDEDARRAKKLKTGDRVDFTAGDFDNARGIMISSPYGPIALLDYEKSFSVAPYMKNGKITRRANVDNIKIKTAPQPRNNTVKISVKVNFSYVDDLTRDFSKKDTVNFYSSDRVRAMAVSLIGKGKLIEHPFLNAWLLEGVLPESYPENNGAKGGDKFRLQIVFGEDFKKCKYTFLLDGQNKKLTDEEKNTAIEIINDRRSLLDEGEILFPVWEE